QIRRPTLAPAAALLLVTAIRRCRAELEAVAEQALPVAVVHPCDALLEAREKKLIEIPEAMLQGRLADPPQDLPRDQRSFTAGRLDELDALGALGNRHAIGED